MDYKNLSLRSFFSFLFIILYLFISLFNFNYIFYLILFLYFLIFLEIFIYFNYYKGIPIFYILISCIFFFFIKFDNESFLTFNLFVFVVVTFDSFSYLIGKTFGKNKLIKISPNKTFEGFLGGFAISLLISLFFIYMAGIELNMPIVLFILFTIVFAFFGDIIESYFKRKNYLKNSSELIPGHGGIFDRFDSFLFSIIFYSISYEYLL